MVLNAASFGAVCLLGARFILSSQDQRYFHVGTGRNRLLSGLIDDIFWPKSNTNALSLITPKGATPHPIPLPDGGEGRVRGPLVKKLNAFVLVKIAKLFQI